MRQVSLREFRTRGVKALESIPKGDTILLAGQQGPASFLVPGAFAKADRREVLLMLAGAVFGVPVGTYILSTFDPLTLRWLIAGMAAAMLLLLLSGWRYHGRPHPLATAGVGAVSGLFNGIAQIGGPPVMSYWLGLGTEPMRLRANVILLFALTGIVSLVSYLWGGLITADVVNLAVWSGPGYAVGTWAGSRMFGLASPSAFRSISLALIALAVLLSLPLHG